MGLIYIIKSNIIKQIYIGQTKKTIDRRWYEHCRKARLYLEADSVEKRNKLNGMHQKLYLAMSLHGINNFYIELIEDGIDVDLLDDTETMYIEEFDAVKNGLNMRSGGKGTNHSDDTKKHISERTKEAFNDVTIIEKMRKHAILEGLPPKCCYHENAVQCGIRVRRHRLCKDRLFEFKNYASIEECKADVIKFVNEIETTGIPYVGGRAKSCKELPGGFRKLQNGYKIQKTFNGKRYTKECTKGDSDEAKFNEALTFLNNLLISKNIPIIEVTYDEINSE